MSNIIPIEIIEKKIFEIRGRKVMIDRHLADLSGVEICKLLKKNEKYKNIPIIMLTAKGEEEDKVKCKHE